MPTELSTYERRLLQETRKIPEEYLPNLLQIVRLFRESVFLKLAGDSFEQGWREVKTGQTKPVSKLWEGIDAAGSS